MDPNYHCGPEKCAFLKQDGKTEGLGQRFRPMKVHNITEES